MTGSRTVVMAPIMQCLVKAEDILGQRRTWRSNKPEQLTFLEGSFSHRDNLGQFSDGELRSWISKNADELNRIAAENSFQIRLDPFSPGEFGTLSILDVLALWKAAGTESLINFNGLSYPAAKLTDGFRVLESPGRDHFIIEVQTQSGDRFYMTIADEEPVNDFALLATVNEIDAQPKTNHSSYDFVQFPMISVDHEVDISWLRGLKTLDVQEQPWIISQALQQTKFRMNHLGAHLESAVMVGMRKCLSLSITIDKPFLLWIKRDGVNFPILSAYFDIDAWKNPGTIN